MVWLDPSNGPENVRAPADRRERGGIVAQPPAASGGVLPRPAPTRRNRAREEDVARVPPNRLPGRSLVTKRAIRDLVRTAVLSAYGVTGFAGGGPVGRVLGGSASRTPACTSRWRTSSRWTSA